MQRGNMKVLIQTPTLVISIIVNCFLIASGHVLMHMCSHALLIRSSQFQAYQRICLGAYLKYIQSQTNGSAARCYSDQNV